MRVSRGYTSAGCEADRFAFGRGFAAWISAWRAACFDGDEGSADGCDSAGMEDRRADSAASTEAPGGALDSCAFSATDCAALRDCLVPKALVSAVRCSRIDIYIIAC